MKKVGLIVNPIAGMGGKVGLKGTDGLKILEKARELGAKKESGNKTKLALEKLIPIKEKIIFITCNDEMGEKYCKELGFNLEVVYNYLGESKKEDSEKALKKIMDKGVEIILFVGGDGTARDVYTSIGEKPVVLGIPAGVKIYSPVYGNTPEQSGLTALSYLNEEIRRTREVEVVDIDEEAYREDIFKTELFGYLNIPDNRKYTQNKKAPTPLTEKASQKAIALNIIDKMERDVIYIIGPGTTTREIMNGLALPYSLLGVDLVRNKKIIKKDLSEVEILNIIKNQKSKLIITPTGGQGYLLGRGNQQISDRVLKEVGKNNIIIIATQSKIIELRNKPLLIDTGNVKVNKEFAGYYKIKIGYEKYIMHKVGTEV